MPKKDVLDSEGLSIKYYERKCGGCGRRFMAQEDEKRIRCYRCFSDGEERMRRALLEGDMQGLDEAKTLLDAEIKKGLEDRNQVDARVVRLTRKAQMAFQVRSELYQIFMDEDLAKTS